MLPGADGIELMERVPELARNSLLRQVWGRRGGGDSERVRTYVKKLRRKLGDDAARPVYIFNKRGVGYRLAGPERD